MILPTIRPGTPISRLLALAVLILILLALWEGLAQPIIDVATGDGPLAAARRSLDDQSRLADRLPAMVREKAELAGRQAAATGFVPGFDPHLAAAALAGRLTAEIKAQGGDLASSEAVDLPDEEGFKRVGLRLTASLPEAALPGLLYGLEFSDPCLFVQSLAIAAGKQDRLTISLDLFGYLGGDGQVPAQLAALPAGSFPDLTGRPLFAPSRRGALLQAATVASSSLRLTGLIADQGRTIALVSLDGGRNEVRIGLGASLNGWRVAAVDGKGLDLAKDGQHLRVALKQAIPPSP
jgi:hypothetical protein